MNIRNLDLNLLVVFEALMEERNVTRAAMRIGLSQPAMSSALGRLRETLDDPLFLRRRSGMEPTPRADALIGPVRTALEELRTALGDGEEFEAEKCHRTFRLLCNDYVEARLLSAVVGQLAAQAPRIRLRSYRQEQLFQAPEAASLTEFYDLALGFFPEQPALDVQLRSRDLGLEKNVCLVRKGHPLLRESFNLQAYAGARHLAVFYKTRGAGLIDALLAESGLQRRLTVQVPHFFSIPFLVANSDLVATVPEGLIELVGRNLLLEVLPVPFPFPDFHFRALWHERRDRDPALHWLLDLMGEQLSGL